MVKSTTCHFVVVVARTVTDMWRLCQVYIKSNLPAVHLRSFADDKMLMVWDLAPSLDMSSVPTGSPSLEKSLSPTPRSQPTAYVIAFPHPLTTVNSHPSTGKEFLVSDCRGSVFITDWRSDPDESEEDNWRHTNLVELVEPRALSDALTGLGVQWTGSAAWRRDTVDL
jgi:hypothetical protein